LRPPGETIPARGRNELRPYKSPGRMEIPSEVPKYNEAGDSTGHLLHCCYLKVDFDLPARVVAITPTLTTTAAIAV